MNDQFCVKVLTQSKVLRFLFDTTSLEVLKLIMTAIICLYWCSNMFLVVGF